jgi:hypothetical protein
MGDVDVHDHGRVAIQGGWHEGNRGTIWHANHMIGIRIKDTTPAQVYVVKHEVQFDGIEGTTYIDNKYCV